MKIQIKRPQFDATLAQRLSGAARASVMAADAKADAAYAALHAATEALELAIDKPGTEINSGNLLVAVEALAAWRESIYAIAKLAPRHSGVNIQSGLEWEIRPKYSNATPENAIAGAIYTYTETLFKAGVNVPRFTNTGKVGDYRTQALALATIGA